MLYLLFYFWYYELKAVVENALIGVIGREETLEFGKWFHSLREKLIFFFVLTFVCFSQKSLLN